ncbi:arsenate reductase (glutaredoxin) [Flavobacterium algicola]|uniref:arsenate reductase (glutaredoxin) n=1 Tax=Flavobacterium algicola TaxID=556529 RepID=UPI001EFCD6F5|nr:arsenate reductase (glutaredoxin) [Flavobacterium algicola]MCG9792820.1 arsenate reductase (glutaredoxin) [Flavobacterium algicola]
MIQIYHNPRCGKSRTCLAFVEDRKLDYEIIKYLDTPPTEEELNDLIVKLKIAPLKLVRQKEKIWIENYKNAVLTDSDIIKILVQHPILIERPIVIKDGDAIIGRDVNELEAFLK